MVLLSLATSTSACMHLLSATSSFNLSAWQEASQLSFSFAWMDYKINAWMNRNKNFKQRWIIPGCTDLATFQWTKNIRMMKPIKWDNGRFMIDKIEQ